MRDRLIELIKKGIDKHESTIENYVHPVWKFVADYLIENGVIVPPCKVGDRLYQVTRNFISEFRVRFIEIATCENLFLHTDIISGIIHTGEVFPASVIGKTVFLTKEEAEKALKGGAE